MDSTNPIARDDAFPLIYHGTNSAYAQFIEREGFSFDAFDVICGSHVRQIVQACDEIHVRPNGYPSAKGYANNRDSYFSINFRSARAYARNAGGERIDGALRAAEGFCSIIGERSQIDACIQHWRAGLLQHGPHEPTESVLRNLCDERLLEGLVSKVKCAQQALLGILHQGYPVVYAVRSDKVILQEPFGGVRLKNVSIERIVAKIMFVNGISPESE